VCVPNGILGLSSAVSADHGGSAWRRCIHAANAQRQPVPGAKKNGTRTKYGRACRHVAARVAGSIPFVLY